MDPDAAPISEELWENGLRWAAFGLGVTVGIVGIVIGALHVVVDTETVERRLNEAVSAATDNRYRAKIEAVDWSLWRRSFHAENVAVYPAPLIFGEDEAMEDSSALYVRTTVPEVRFGGVHLWRLYWHRTLKADSTIVGRPRVYLKGSRRTDARARQDRSVHAGIASLLPAIDIQHLRLDGGTAVWERSSVGALDAVWGLSVQMDGVEVDSTWREDPNRLFFSDSVRVEMDGYHRTPTESSYAITMGPMQVASSDSTVVIRNLRLAPTVSDAAFMQRQEHRTNRMRMAARRIAARGVPFRRFVENRSLAATALAVDSLVVDVYRDNRLPAAPTGAPPPMPHEAFQKIDRDVRVDTLRVRNGHIRYEKWKEESANTGHIAFENVWATVYNVTNDTSRMTRATPAVIDARTRVAGAGWLNTTIRLPLLSPSLDLSYMGHLGPMDARAFNTAFVDLAGVRVESGRVDSLWFEADVEHGVAAGTMNGVYRDLDVETLDRATGDRGLRKRFETFVLNTVLLKSSNTPDDGPLRTGTIDHVREEGDSFFKFLWHSVRSGLFSLVDLPSSVK